VPVGDLLPVACLLTLSIQTLDFLLVKLIVSGDGLLVTCLLLLLVSLTAVQCSAVHSSLAVT
jgi:hypothetical protein